MSPISTPAHQTRRDGRGKVTGTGPLTRYYGAVAETEIYSVSVWSLS